MTGMPDFRPERVKLSLMITVSLVVREFILEIDSPPLPRWAETVKVF